MTVEGSYQNLRRFIREIETSKQFIVISAVELEPTENEEKQTNRTTVRTTAGGDQSESAVCASVNNDARPDAISNPASRKPGQATTADDAAETTETAARQNHRRNSQFAISKWQRIFDVRNIG